MNLFSKFSGRQKITL